jgi:hypothetical protein
MTVNWMGGNFDLLETLFVMSNETTAAWQSIWEKSSSKKASSKEEPVMS